MNIKLVVSEVDGVIAKSNQPVDELGNTPFKYFFMPDFEAINRIKLTCPFVFISSDNSVSYNLCRNKNIPFYWAKKNKTKVLLNILRRYNVTADEVLYIGSKLSDIPCMNMIPNSMSTLTGVSSITSSNVSSIDSEPGEGVLLEVYLQYFKN